MIASTWTDLVLGVDIHIMLVPTPAGPVPTPLPHPFTGIVLDPAALAMTAATGGGMVLINGLPATNCGTEVMNLPPHLPVPGPFAKGKPDNDALLIFGALNVEIAGSLGVRLAEIALSCSDPVRMPTSLVLAVPKGPLVLVVRPPVPDLKLLATMLAFKVAGAILKGLAKLLGKFIRFLQRGPLSKFFKAISKKMKSKNPKGSRGRQMWNDFVCFLTGHPIDVATGRVITSQTDLEPFGTLPLTFSRRYDSSASNRPGVLGFGWAHPFDQAVWPERGAVVLRAEDGREIEFSTLDFPDHAIAPGREVFLPHEGLTLRVHGDHHFSVADKNGTVRQFARIPGASTAASTRSPELAGLRNRETRLVSITNRLGQRQLFHYDQLGNLESVTDPAGRRLQFQYDREGRLLRADITGTDGITHIVGIYRYDSAGDLVEAMDALGHAYRYEYVEHLLVKETNKNGLSFYFQYDGVDSTAKCVRTWGDGGIYDHVITYDPQNKRTLVENSLGYITLYQLDELGQVVSILDANGAVTKYEYEHPSGQQTKETDPNGAESISEYDERGNVIKTIDAEGAEITFDYDHKDRLTRAVDPIGGQWRWGYDENGRLIGRANPLEERTQFHWDGPRLVAVTDPLGQHTRLTHDSAENLVSLTTPDEVVTYWSYDGLGRTRTTTDPNGNTRRLERDPLGRILQVAEPDGNLRSLTYDPEGNILRAQDRLYDVAFEYRGLNRLAARTQAGRRVEFHYDTEDQLTAVRNEYGFAYRFILGPTGYVDEEWGFDNLRRRYVRDPAGRIIEVLRPEGRTSKYSYDKGGRVTAVEHDDGTREAYGYRLDGALIKAENAAAIIEFERDPLGRITKELIGEDWVGSEYDVLGFRKTIRSSKGVFQTIRRNGMGDVLAVDAEIGGASSSAGTGTGTGIGIGGERTTFNAIFSRDRLGLELERQLPGGIRARWERDSLGRPVRHEIWRGDRYHGAKQYVWDVNDRLKKIIDAMDGPVDYKHDAVGNLSGAVYADGKVDLRMPDAVGNLFRTADCSDRKYGPAGQLLESHDPRGVTRYEYDPEGNLIKKVERDGATWTYTWSPAGTLAKVTRPNGHAVEFAYDALARRTRKSYRGKITRWIWDGNVPLHEWVERTADAVDEDFARQPQQDDSLAANEKALKALLAARPANGPPQSDDSASKERARSATLCGTRDSPITWLFEPESFSPLAKLVQGDCHAIVTDHLGAPTAMFDSSGQEVWAAEFDVYGNLRIPRGETQACPFRWPGQYADEETGLYYNRSRYYDPAIGEYTSQDRLGLGGGLPLYGYVSDPLIWCDPVGFAPHAGCGQPRYTAQSRHHVYTHGHAANAPRIPNKSRFRPTEGGQKFSSEVVNHPNVIVTPQGNGRIKYEVPDLGRVTGTDRHGNPVRGGTVIVEGQTPASWSTYTPDEVVTQFPT